MIKNTDNHYLYPPLHIRQTSEVLSSCIGVVRENRKVHFNRYRERRIRVKLKENTENMELYTTERTTLTRSALGKAVTKHRKHLTPGLIDTLNGKKRGSIKVLNDFATSESLWRLKDCVDSLWCD